MKKCGILLVSLFFLTSCVKYHVKEEINSKSALSKLKKSGIIVRLTHNSPIPVKLANKNLSQWLEPYKKQNRLTLIEGTSKKVYIAKNESERFFQYTSSDDFQYYQSIGIIKEFLNSNKEELDKIRSENDLDSLILYEVDAGFSVELQYDNFSSMIVIVDNKDKILFLDRQVDKYETFEIDGSVLREELLDLISNRLIDVLARLKFVKEIN